MLQLFFKTSLIENLHIKLWVFKMTFECLSRGKHREYYKGEGGGFPQVKAMSAHGSFVPQKCSNYALTNLLFGLCRFV